MWEVAAQMLGLGGSILALRAIEDSGSPTNVLWAWATFQVQDNVRRFNEMQSRGRCTAAVTWDVHGCSHVGRPRLTPYQDCYNRLGHAQLPGVLDLLLVARLARGGAAHVHPASLHCAGPSVTVYLPSNALNTPFFSVQWSLFYGSTLSGGPISGGPCMAGAPS